MKTILVTGGIGTGKSEVCRYLRGLGYPVYDSDSRCKALYEEVPGLKGRIEEAIGVPFAQIRIIFSDAAKREALESVVYPELLKDFLRWRDSQDSELVFFESAIASGKGIFDGLFDKVVLVTAPEHERISRCMQRDGSSREAVIERIRIQSPFAPHDFQIPNIGNLEQLHSRVQEFLKKI